MIELLLDASDAQPHVTGRRVGGAFRLEFEAALQRCEAALEILSTERCGATELVEREIAFRMLCQRFLAQRERRGKILRVCFHARFERTRTSGIALADFCEM